MRFKQYLEEDKKRYYAEVRLFDEKGDDYIHDIVDDLSKTPEALFKKASKWAKKELKGEGKIKINIHDREHPKGEWIIISKEIKV